MSKIDAEYEYGIIARKPPKRERFIRWILRQPKFDYYNQWFYYDRKQQMIFGKAKFIKRKEG